MPFAMSFRISCHTEIQRFESEATRSSGAKPRLTLAEDAKGRGSQHYDRSAFARASRRYGDALR